MLMLRVDASLSDVSASPAASRAGFGSIRAGFWFCFPSLLFLRLGWVLVLVVLCQLVWLLLLCVGVLLSVAVVLPVVADAVSGSVGVGF